MILVRKPILTLVAMIGALALIVSSFAAVLGASTAQDAIRQSDSRLEQEDWSPPDAVYVTKTGQSVQGPFLDFWREWGGAASFGYPVTPELEENGQTVQYFTHARLEISAGGAIELADIGVEFKAVLMQEMEQRLQQATDQIRAEEARQTLNAAEPVDPAIVSPGSQDRRFIDVSGHIVQFAFKSFWENTGETDDLGLPITGEFTQNDVTYQ